MEEEVMVRWFLFLENVWFVSENLCDMFVDCTNNLYLWLTTDM